VDVYWSLSSDGSPNTLGRLNDVLEGVGLPPWLVAVLDFVVELIGIPTRAKFASGPRRPIIAHSVPALGFTYLEEVLRSIGEWSDTHVNETIWLRLNNGAGPGYPGFSTSDNAVLKELTDRTLNGTFLGYTEPAWNTVATGVQTWLSTHIGNVPHSNGLSRSGLLAGSRHYSSLDNTYENIVAVLGEHPLYVVASDFWTSDEIAEIAAASAPVTFR